MPFQKGHPDFVPKESRKRASGRMKGVNNPFYGKKHSKETILKIKEKLKGRKSWNKGLKGYLAKEKNWHWKGGKPKCINCDKTISYGRQVCISCFNKARIGEKHPRWKGGVSRDTHSLCEPKYKQWRMGVFARDNFKCKINNQDCKGQLQAHHILPWRDFPELRYDINNGITLCQFHHPRKRVDEQRLIPFFQGMVEVN